MQLHQLLVPCCIILFLSCQPDVQQHQYNGSIHDTIVGQKPQPVPSFNIIPGKSIGDLNIGDEAAVAEEKLKKPDISDAAMGKAWMTWLGKKDEHNNQAELNVFTAYQDTSMKTKTIQLIRTTSAAFHTTDSVQVYQALDEIGKVFPTIKYKGHFKEEGSSRLISIYDVTDQGIAFDISVANDQKICTAIIVHEKNRDVMENYRSFLLSRGFTAVNVFESKGQ